MKSIFNTLPLTLFVAVGMITSAAMASENLADEFANPPDSARPGVYWYFMDGNQDRDCMTADLEAMHRAGLRKALFLEVNIGVPRGPVDFMSEPWQENFAHAVHTADRLGMEIILGTGPGWAGAGGPWVDPARSMQHLCASSVKVKGPGPFTEKLPIPAPRKPSQFAGLSPPLGEVRNQWHADVAVLAFPTPAATSPPELLDIKALYETQPYSIWKHVPRHITSLANYPETDKSSNLNPSDILDITKHLRPDGSLDWNVPPGEWTVMRFAARNNSVTTRPAPNPGHGFETDKFSAEAFSHHFQQFHQKLLNKVGPRRPGRGWTALHLDSWESSSQNWSAAFREEFKNRRGYDPLPYYPAYTGLLVGSREITERFLWDLRKTAQELLLENHAQVIKRHAHENGMYYSSQFYDMNPAGDLDLGAVADVPSCEFWTGAVDSVYSCIEGASIAHTMGRPVLRAESFTSMSGYHNNPADLKNQTDWAFAMGINDFIIHTFQHQPLGIDGPKPGMAMGPHGINWHRNQTFWPMVGPYHDYIARCGQMLRQGVSVCDILYLTPEGAPHIFMPPDDAMHGSGIMREKKGHGFDAVSPRILMTRAKAEIGRIAFPGGSSYRLLVLPEWETMTPELLTKIETLVRQGITVVGNPPLKSPSLTNYPKCDGQVRMLAEKIWGDLAVPKQVTNRTYGKGLIIWGGAATLPRETSNDFLFYQNSQWIWSPLDDPAATAPAGVTRYFQKKIVMEPRKKLRAAQLQITSDNDFELWVNGESVAKGDNFHVVQTVDLASILKPGENLLAVSVINTGSTPNPAGLIAAISLQYEDGSTDASGTDTTWRVTQQAEDGWQRQAGTGESWRAAKLLGPSSMAPWNLSPKPATVYPSFQSTSALLQTSGMAPPFESAEPIRHHQRRTDTRDLFFVSNREAKPVDALCTFRTDGAAPELWDPVTTKRRPLPKFEIKGDTVSLPLSFAPHESYFIVFDRKALRSATPQVAENFAVPRILATLDGSYKVTFDPAWGGPKEPVTFENLASWSTHAEKGIRYYSGEATYHKSFHLPAGIIENTQVFLDLGVVQKIARVTLNGKDLGIVWTPPFRVDVTGKLLATENKLEITVANTWVNRLIGDLQPEDKDVRKLSWKSGLLGGGTHSAGRYTFTTSSGVNAGSTLEKSGLLGNVTLQSVTSP